MVAVGHPVRPRRPIRKAERPFRPYGGAERLFYCQDEEILFDGPAGTGKTRAALEKVYLCACKYDGCRVLLTRKTRASLTESVLVTWEEKVVPEGSALLRGPQRNTRQHYSFENGSEVVVGGMDNADRIMSTEYDLIVVFEATELTADDIEKLTTRLRNGVIPYQQIIFDCNPAGSRHHLKIRADAGHATRIPSRHEDNPYLYNHRLSQWTNAGISYLAKLDRLSGARRERLRSGRWVNAEGAVYEDFDAAMHVVDWSDFPDNKIPADWRRFRCVDFGFTNPFVCQWWAVDGDGRMYLYRELYRVQGLAEDHAREIVRLSEGERIEKTIADHDAEDRATMQRHGVQTVAAVKDVQPGIQHVQARLRKAGDGKPRIFFLREALVSRDRHLAASSKPCCTIEEFDNYLWPQGKDGKPEKEEPMKLDDHGMDAMRYAVMAEDATQQVRAVVLGAPGINDDDDDYDEDGYWL